jgi:uncharacterized protein YjdB
MQVRYQAHVQDVGWQEWVSDGEIAGTVGQSRRIEALRIQLLRAPAGTGVQYRAHIQDRGWQDWVADGAVAGTTGEGLRIEALEIRLAGEHPGASSIALTSRTSAGKSGWQMA